MEENEVEVQRGRLQTIEDLKIKFDESEAKIASLMSDYRSMETRHFDFVAAVKALLVCDASMTDDNPIERLKCLTDSLNQAILIDFDVKEEPCEVKKENEFEIAFKVEN